MPRLLFVLLLLVSLCSGCTPSVNKKEPTIFTKQYSPEQLREDLRFLIDTLEEVHPNLYAYTNSSIIRSKIAFIRNKLASPMNRMEFYRLLAPLIAQFGDAHTAAYAPLEELQGYANAGGTFFPCGVRLENRNIVIQHSLVEPDILSGWRLVSLNGIPAGALIAKIGECISAEREVFRQKLIEINFTSYLWLIHNITGPYSAVFLTPDGKRVTAKVPGLTAAEIDSRLADIKEEPYSFFTIAGGKIGFLDFRSFSKPEQFDTFLEQTFKKIKERNIQALVIDLRRNGGGDSSMGDALLTYLTAKPFRQYSRIDMKISKQIKSRYPGLTELEMFTIGSVWSRNFEFIEPKENPLLFTGRVYVLIGPNTFSSATNLASAIKDLGLGVVVGEETGGLATGYGELYTFNLPNTKLQFGVSSKYFVRPSGKKDGRGVLPDYEFIASDDDAIYKYIIELNSK